MSRMMAGDHNGSANAIPLQELLRYLDDLVAAFQEHPDPETREAVMELLRATDTLHWQAFRRLATFLAERGADHLLAEAAQSDRLIYTVLSLYDVLPDEVVVAQVEAALDRVRPYIESHGGQIKVRAVEQGVVHLEMGGACSGCAGVQYTLERGVHQALAEGFPSFEEIVVHEPAAGIGAGGQGLISVDQIYLSPSVLQAPDFKSVLSLAEVPENSMTQVELEGVQLLIVNAAGDIYALGNLCPGSMLPLSSGELKGTAVVCPWHGEVYDVRTGACLDDAGRREPQHLAVYPVAIKEDQIQVAVNVPARPLLVGMGDG